VDRTTTACRRKQRRHRIAPDTNARVEFAFPHPGGARHSLPLVDLSLSGFSFRMSPELSWLETGTMIPEVVIHLGGCTLQGELLLMHVTRREGICGALFYPATDTDLIKLKSLIAGIEAVQTA
jgi:hypothetical protein